MNNLTIPQSRPHIEAIDGLRGVAILSVVIHHWIIQPLTPILTELRVYNLLSIFAYGVDLFFVISGFLIGGILLKVRKKTSGIAAFYLRRIMRIWPLYYLLLGMVFLLGGGPGVFGKIPYWSFILFIFNFWESIGLPFHSAFGPLWSLAIEEQFYLVGPLFFSFLEKRGLVYLSALWILVSPFLRWALMVNTNLDTWRFTPVRLDGICTGIFLSVFLSREDIALSLSKKTGELIVATIMLFVVSLFCKAVMSDIFWYSFGNSILVLSFGFLLTTALAQRLLNHGHGILSSVMLRYLGLRCYSIYLFHILFMLSISALISNFFVGLLTQTILTLGFAHMSWKYIEYPLINLARRFSY